MGRLILQCASLLVGGFGAFVILCGIGNRSAAPAAAERGNVPAVRAAECRWATGPIQLDGKLDEPAWQNAQPIKDFAVYWENRKPKTATTARLLWDDKYLYFGAEMEDTDLYADVKEHNGMCWFNDVFEMFFRPDERELAYYEFQVNAANTQLEMFLPSRGAGGYGRFHHGRLGIESQVTLNGTLNQWEDKDVGWIVEGRIPWTGFQATGGKPKAGAKWRFTFCRYDYSVGYDRAELSATAPLTRSDFHRYEDYGELTFVGAQD
ncbi:MAG TPA: carbohydrate-binding family 9-like protein [Gemmataceae bacterium]|nr:carbohydrate-binding family 9-like protein [Gemmataceae bacterium]